MSHPTDYEDIASDTTVCRGQKEDGRARRKARMPRKKPSSTDACTQTDAEVTEGEEVFGEGIASLKAEVQRLRQLHEESMWREVHWQSRFELVQFEQSYNIDVERTRIIQNMKRTLLDTITNSFSLM